ncbi:MAG: hypothetical protein HFF76_12780 [Oscillospiraceae bacterium]|jgi:ABC-2 type transport system permease protein|nr:hypothetical protein [Oscillospiraceae bacterium]
MRNLLCAGLRRLVKSRTFLFALLAVLAYTALVVLVCWDHCAQGAGNYTLEAILTSGFGLMGYLSVPSLIYAALLSVHLGADYSDGALRNKLTVGRTREQVYLADLLTCVIASVGLDVLYLLLSGALCAYPVLEARGVLLRASPGQVLAWVAAALLARAAWAAAVKLTVTVLGSRTAGAVAALLMVVGAMILCQFSFSQIQFLSNCLGDGLPVKNGAARLAFWQLLMDLLPTGQSLQVSMLYTPTLWRLPLLSAAVFAVSTGAGLLFFRRRDLK